MTLPPTPSQKSDIPAPETAAPSINIVSLFEAQALARGDSPALTLDAQSLSYRDLNARANAFARCLLELNVAPGALVGILLDRSFDLIAGIIGILKVGAAYLPLDLACPADRLQFLLADSAAPVVITHSSLRARLDGFSGRVICVDVEGERLAQHTAENPAVPIAPADLAYIIYTSGSTGQPKGVLVTHENVTRLFSTTEELFHFGTQDSWALFFSSAFDFSVWEIFGALLYGGRLVIVPYMVCRSASALRQLILREGVTVLNQTPSAFRQFVTADQAAPAEKTALRYIIFGGETLEYQSLRPWFARHGTRAPQLVNMYGITETTVHVTFHPVRLIDLDRGGSNVGRPLPDLQVHLIDEKGAPVAPGEVGEILVGGLGVARGYLNRPELTAERFVPDPFAPDSGARFYRSGDLARRRENGDLEFLGRRDHQVKVRGFRVELPEIESTLARHPGVRECAVLSRLDGAPEPHLVAYLVLKAGAVPEVETMRAHLARSLPEYMVPSEFVFLSEFPLTLNGKLDRAMLPAPGAARPQLSAPFVAPQNDLEHLLAGLWKETLRRSEVGTDDNFFDLGGDSIRLTSLHCQLQVELKRDVPIIDLFQFPTIRALAAHLTLADSQPRDGAAQARGQRQRDALQRARQTASSTPR